MISGTDAVGPRLSKYLTVKAISSVLIICSGFTGAPFEFFVFTQLGQRAVTLIPIGASS
jgi:hypothetical protein